MSASEASLVGPARILSSSRAVGRGARRLEPADLGRHLDRLYRAAWALCGSREDAEDLVQETYARVLARPRFLRSDDDLGYLLRVLRHAFISSLRARDRRPHDFAPIDEAEIADPATARRPDELAETREVYVAISALPPNFRDALVAVDVVGLSYTEAAKGLGVKEATITTRLHRARERVIAELDGSGRNQRVAASNADGDGQANSTGGCRPAARRDRGR